MIAVASFVEWCLAIHHAPVDHVNDGAVDRIGAFTWVSRSSSDCFKGSKIGGVAFGSCYSRFPTSRSRPARAPPMPSSRGRKATRDFPGPARAIWPKAVIYGH